MSHTRASQREQPITLFTIGFTGHLAEEFFTKLQSAGVKTLFDVRLKNASQLAGFAKKNDLEYFLKTIAGIEYVHATNLAPTEELFDDFKKHKAIDWAEYQQRFTQLLAERQPEQQLRPVDLHRGCLLCSEHTHENCHRRLVVEHLQRAWKGVKVVHL